MQRMQARPTLDTTSAIDHNDTSNDHAPRFLVMDCSTLNSCMSLSYHYLRMTNVTDDRQLLLKQTRLIGN